MKMARDHNINNINASYPTTLSMEEAMANAGYGRFQILSLLFLCLSLVGFGATTTMLSFLSPCAEITMQLSSNQTSAIGSVIFIGQLVGVLSFGSCADMMGRKISFLASISFIMIFCIGIFLSKNFIALCFCLTLIGFGSGGSSIAHPYVAEIMPVKYRGSALVLLGIMNGLGSVFISGGAWLILGILNLDWHYLCVFTLVPFVLSAVGICLYLPESPRWLHTKMRSKDALAVLQKISKRNQSDWDEAILLQPYQDCNVHEKAIWSSVLDPRSQYPTFSLCLLGMMANFIFVCLTLIVPYFLQNEGETKGCSFDFTFIFFSSSAQPICSTLAIYTIEKSRRIPNMLSFFFGSLLFLMLGSGISRSTFLVVSFLTRGLVSITNNIFWAIVPEYYPTEIRATVTGLLYAVICLAMSTSSFWVYDSGTSKEGTCALLSAMCIFSILIIYCFLPETAGKVLDGIENSVDGEEDAEFIEKMLPLKADSEDPL